MLYHVAADAVLLHHFAFIAFIILGAVLVARWRWLVIIHIPAAMWGFLVELTGVFAHSRMPGTSFVSRLANRIIRRATLSTIFLP